MCNHLEATGHHNPIKLLSLLPLRAIQNHSFQYKTPYMQFQKELEILLQKIFQPFCGEPCVGFIMTKCYDGKNAKTNACGSGIQAPCCYAYAFSQYGQTLYELAFRSFYSPSSLLKMFEVFCNLFNFSAKMYLDIDPMVVLVILTSLGQFRLGVPVKFNINTNVNLDIRKIGKTWQLSFPV